MFLGSSGDRSSVTNILVVLTDGLSNDPNQTWQEAMLTRQANITILTVSKQFSFIHSMKMGRIWPKKTCVCVRACVQRERKGEREKGKSVSTGLLGCRLRIQPYSANLYGNICQEGM